MSLDGFPFSDLSLIIFMPPPHVIPAIPLKPTARIIRMYPALLAPNRQGLAGINTEEIRVQVVSFRAEFRSYEPASRKFVPAVSHILATENAQLKHFPWAQFWFEFDVKTSSSRLCQLIAVAGLHFVLNDH
jgi:hypothetical protein